MAVGEITARGVPLTNMVCGRSQLAAGTVSVALPTITDNSLIFLSGNNANVDGVVQAVITSGTGFVITSQTGGDVGFVSWLVIIIP